MTFLSLIVTRYFDMMLLPSISRWYLTSALFQSVLVYATCVTFAPAARRFSSSCFFVSLLTSSPLLSVPRKSSWYRSSNADSMSEKSLLLPSKRAALTDFLFECCSFSGSGRLSAWVWVISDSRHGIVWFWLLMLLMFGSLWIYEKNLCLALQSAHEERLAFCTRQMLHELDWVDESLVCPQIESGATVSIFRLDIYDNNTLSL